MSSFTLPEALLSPLQLGALQLKNRAIMAPLTRCRAGVEHLPNDLMAEYYSQRASAGLVITECTMVQAQTSAFWQEPGIYSEAQVAGWKKVTDRVHAAGGQIVMQIWHAGRAAHPALNQGAECVSSSSKAIEGEVHTPEGKLPYVAPRELTDEEIPAIVQAFAQGAKNAKAAGFDGVEVHAANGYLIDQFLRDGSNQRSGKYGGSMANRARFLLEVLDAVCAVWGNDRVGVRLSPLNSYNSMIDSDPMGLTQYLAKALNPYQLAYLHLMRADFFQAQSGDVMTPAREHYQGKLIGNMGYSADEANQAISADKLDAVAFGTGFLANPDLVARIQSGAPWNKPHPATFYTPGAEGYTDYPFLTV
jgi:N-ethylmaleimide reductase